MKKIVVIQIAGLGWEFLQKQSTKLKLNWQKAETVTPALTCSVQASFKTATKAKNHGIVANGFFFNELHKPLFWEQNSKLIEGERIWENAQKSGRKAGVLFWQQSLGNDADVLLSPAPVHKHHGGMIQDCYDLPRGLYGKLKEKCGGFNLMHYWGPLTSNKSTKWIVKATSEIMQSEAPDLLLTYLPHLDYELQKSGTEGKKSKKAFAELETELEILLSTAKENGYEAVIFGDYAIMNVDQVVYPNKILREKGLLKFRQIKGMLYPDYYNSDALAIVDHQVAHVKLFDSANKAKIKALLEQLDGVAKVIDGEEAGEFGAGHKRAGELILVSKPNAWFSYQWWDEKREAPDYSTHVDIHNKPGFDPCELFFGFPPPFATSTDSTKVKGSHGLAGKEFPIAWYSTLNFDEEINSIIDLSKAVKKEIER